jgi:hypothetical protein
MKLAEPVDPYLDVTPDQLLQIFLKENYISDPLFFGLPSFSIFDLEKNSFDICGDNEFSLYEKTFKLKSGYGFINLKCYFHNKQFISNGIDLFNNVRTTTLFRNYYSKYHRLTPILSIELLLDDTLECGSFIINKYFEVRFAKSYRKKRKMKYHTVGISTDYEAPSNSFALNGNTHGAKIMKNQVSFNDALQIYNRDPAISNLLKCVYKFFPDALI